VNARTAALAAVLLAACGRPAERDGAPTASPGFAPQAVATLRDLVFADQDLDEVVALQKDSPLDDPASPWPRLASAARLRREDPEAAIAELQQVLELPGLETRVELWTWTALRALGVAPDARVADTVQGVVVELPAGDGRDTVAVFRDGTMRYFDRTGRAAFWDPRERASAPETAELVRRPIALAERLTPAERGPVAPARPAPAPGTVRVSFLTFGGIRRRDVPAAALAAGDPLAAVVSAGSEVARRASASTR
jgi:hypothetical protein